MILEHLLLTRFSYRLSPQSDLIGWVTTEDPLAPWRLDTRLRLFETLCLPTILGQTHKDFWWILVVDPALPQSYRTRLTELTRPHAKTRLVAYDDNMEIGGLTWLSSFIDPSTTHVVTTNMDDDDLLSSSFIAYIQQHLHGLYRSGRLPSCGIIGSREYIQWDFMPTRQAPLGYLKPWHRGRFITNAGLTFFGRYPQYDISCLAFHHYMIEKYFGSGTPVDRAMARLRACAEAGGDDWSTWSPDACIHEIQGFHPQVIVANHTDNDQMTRLYEGWANRTAIRGPEDLPGITVSLDVVQRNIQAFRCSPAVVARYLFRGFLSLLHGTLPSREIWRRFLIFYVAMPWWLMFGMPRWLQAAPPPRKRA